MAQAEPLPGKDYEEGLKVFSDKTIIHRDRGTALQEAGKVLLSDETLNKTDVLKFLDQVSLAAQAEGDQGNTIFSKDGIMTAFRDYSKDTSKMEDYMTALKGYVIFLKTDHPPAGPDAFKFAAINNISITHNYLESEKIKPAKLSQEQIRSIFEAANRRASEFIDDGVVTTSTENAAK